MDRRIQQQFEKRKKEISDLLDRRMRERQDKAN